MPAPSGGPGPPGFPRRVRSSSPVRALPGPPLPRSSQTSRPPGPPAPRPRGLVLRSPASRWAGPHRLLPPGIWGGRHSQGHLGPPSPTLTLRNVGRREPDADAREGVGVSRRLSSAAAVATGICPVAALLPTLNRRPRGSVSVSGSVPTDHSCHQPADKPPPGSLWGMLVPCSPSLLQDRGVTFLQRQHYFNIHLVSLASSDSVVNMESRKEGELRIQLN